MADDLKRHTTKPGNGEADRAQYRRFTTHQSAIVRKSERSTTMTRFNPFEAVNSRYGAPMGRLGHDPDQYDGKSRLYARHCGGDGFYDRGGAYWGHSHVWAVWTRGGGFCTYVEARSKEAAIKLVNGKDA